jgi:hypothetical protein
VKALKSTKSTTTTSTSTTTSSTSTTNTKIKQMLSLELLNGRGNQNQNQNTKDKPAQPIRPPGKEQSLEKVVVDLQIVSLDRVGLTKKIKNKEVEEVFMSIPGNKLGKLSCG